MNTKMLTGAKELIGKEMDVIQLSNILTREGFEDICYFGNWEEIFESESVVVADDKGENQIIIEFEVTAQNGEDEVITATVIKIKDINEF